MLKNKIHFLLLLMVISFGFSLNAQTVKGVVTDANGGLAGVNVIVKNTNNGASTDFDGNYQLENVKPDAVLVFSFLGYVTQEIPVNGQSIVSVTLIEDNEALDEFVIVGYSSRRKSDITNAVSVVDVEGIQTVPTSSVVQQLQGRVAGVQVRTTSGAPGDPIEIRIRGTGTIGNNNPLYIVDGVQTRDIAFLNQGDIKTMTVLKDAASAAIYGARGSAGVVLITTKSGTIGKPSFDVSYYKGISNTTNLPKLRNASQWLDNRQSAWDDVNTGTNPYIAIRNRSDLSDTDWFDELFDTGDIQNLNLSTSGGNGDFNYFMSLGYYDENGTVLGDKDKFKRLNFRTNIDANLTERLKVGANFQVSHSTLNGVASSGESLARFALIRSPLLSVFKDANDPTYSAQDPYTDLAFFGDPNFNFQDARNNFGDGPNPLQRLHFTDNETKKFRTFGSLNAQYAFLGNKELVFRSSLGIDLEFSHNKAFFENYGDDDGQGVGTEAGLGRWNRPNSLSESRAESLDIIFANTLNYQKTFSDKHNLNTLVGTEYVTNYDSDLSGFRSRFPYTTDEFRFLDNGNSLLDMASGGTASEWSLFSYFGSASYSYDDKYILTANVRADASSRFSEKNRWGYFPSISAGWIISKENFLSDVTWLNQLKFRASWGQVGNQNIDNYAFLKLIEEVNGVVGLKRYENPDLKWETTEQTNIGMDISILNNKLSASAEYFDKTTSDILLPIGLPGFLGNVEPTIYNAGVVNNKGFEFSINYKNFDKAFKYSINANLATLKNNVEELHPNLPDISGRVYRTVPGQPIFSYYGYKFVGIYQNQAEIDSHLFSDPKNTRPGDMKFEDVDGDGSIDLDSDRQSLGSPNPDLTYGFSFSAEYKNFDASLFFQGVQGVERYHGVADAFRLDNWNGDGTSNTVPRASNADTGGGFISSYKVEDGSYFRMKNAEIGYTLNGIKGIQSLRLYVSGTNLFTITDYSGLDPESTDQTNQNPTDFLVDKGTTPLSQTFLFGVNLKF
jgi:TonB-linked SusC/RagA family outer membrane protein